MKIKTIGVKLIPVCVVLPFLLTACQDINSFFGGSSSHNPGYDSNYSSTKAHTGHKPQNVSTDYSNEASKASVKTTASESGTAATTVSSPVATEKKGVTGTVDTPAVPSMAPTVGQ
jgi:hypothetical protein